MSNTRRWRRRRRRSAGGTTTASGARRSARAIGIALRTPNGRTSYEAASTTPALGVAADDDGAPAQLGVVALLDGRVERVHVEVNKGAATPYSAEGAASSELLSPVDSSSDDFDLGPSWAAVAAVPPRRPLRPGDVVPPRRMAMRAVKANDWSTAPPAA